jgi:hypothetical protein
VDAETNGKPDRELVLRATEAEPREFLDHYRDTTHPGGAALICGELGCWDPATETFDQFLARKRGA